MKGDKVSYFNPQDGGGDKDEGEDEIGGREKREADPTGIITITKKHTYNLVFWSLSLGILGIRLLACLEGKFGRTLCVLVIPSNNSQDSAKGSF